MLDFDELEVIPLIAVLVVSRNIPICRQTTIDGEVVTISTVLEVLVARQVPFCCFGADIKPDNRSQAHKVHGGVIRHRPSLH